MSKHYVLLICLSIAGSSLQAQTKINSGWLANFNTIKFSSHWSLHSDFQFRSTDGYGTFQTILLRTGVNYHAGKRSVITAGYAYIPNRSGISGNYKLLAEHRLWQQYMYNQPIKNRISLQHRFRFEERWIPVAEWNGNDLEKGDEIFATRFRYFFRTIIPWKIDKDAFSKGFFTGLQNEVFLNTSAKDKLNGKHFDQNRFYLSIGYRMSKQIDLETGYLWQYSDRKLPNENINNHVAQLAIYTRL